MEEKFKSVISHSKEYGFIYPSSEIYEGLSAIYDYGPYGAELKKNIKDYWWSSMVKLNDNIVGLDSAIFMHPKIWKASGHVDAFNDPLIDNRDSKKRYRADQLIEGYVEKIEKKIEREIQKASKRFGDSFDEEQFLNTSQRVIGYQKEIRECMDRFNEAMRISDLKELKQIIEDYKILDPVSGSGNWTDVRQFNLMFSTQMGHVEGEDATLYLRPETAQGIFVNFNNVLNTSRQQIPFGIAQIGKAFRNEIIARQFIFRMREFEQMEMQFFVKPGTELDWYETWKEKRMNWHLSLGFGEENYRFHDHENLSHYANAAVDIEFKYPFGFKELEGIHSRTDYDLSRHQEMSGKRMQFFDPVANESYVPYVVETSIGVDRLFLAVMSAAYTEESVPDADGKESSRIVLKLPAAIAPVKCAILPLVRNKEEITGLARSIYDQLKLDFQCQYDEKDTIGKRYRRQDAIGTPFCVTVDFDSLEDNMVTIRNRDTLEQDRISITEVKEYVEKRCSVIELLKSL